MARTARGCLPSSPSTASLLALRWTERSIRAQDWLSVSDWRFSQLDNNLVLDWKLFFGKLIGYHTSDPYRANNQPTGDDGVYKPPVRAAEGSVGAWWSIGTISWLVQEVFHLFARWFALLYWITSLDTIWLRKTSKQHKFNATTRVRNSEIVRFRTYSLKWYYFGTIFPNNNRLITETMA